MKICIQILVVLINNKYVFPSSNRLGVTKLMKRRGDYLCKSILAFLRVECLQPKPLLLGLAKKGDKFSRFHSTNHFYFIYISNFKILYINIIIYLVQQYFFCISVDVFKKKILEFVASFFCEYRF